jgi:hypothetical protein
MIRSTPPSTAPDGTRIKVPRREMLRELGLQEE